MKTCPRCSSEVTGRSDKVYCSSRCNNKAWVERHRENAETRAEKKQRDRKSWLKTKYSLSLDDYNYLVVTQSDRCAICLTDEKGRHGNWSVDHDHETGEVRGLLCDPCNTGLGKFFDDADNLRDAATYLEGVTQ